MIVKFHHPPVPNSTNPFNNFDPSNPKHYPTGPGIYIYGLRLEIEINGKTKKKFVPIYVGETDNLERRLSNEHYKKIAKGNGNKELWDFSLPIFSPYYIYCLYSDMLYYDIHNNIKSGKGKIKEPPEHIKKLSQINKVIYFQNSNYFRQKFGLDSLEKVDRNYYQACDYLKSLSAELPSSLADDALALSNKILKTLTQFKADFYFIFATDKDVMNSKKNFSFQKLSDRLSIEVASKKALKTIGICTTADSERGEQINSSIDLSIVQDDLINLGGHNYGYPNYNNPLSINIEAINYKYYKEFMKTVKQNIIKTNFIQDIGKLIKANREIVTQVWKRDEDRASIYFGNLYINTDNPGITFCLMIDLNLNELWNEYKKLPGEKKFDVDFTDNDKMMEGFLDSKAYLIIEHLKRFNGVADNYSEIAKMVDGTIGNYDDSRGSMLGKVYGV